MLFVFPEGDVRMMNALKTDRKSAVLAPVDEQLARIIEKAQAHGLMLNEEGALLPDMIKAAV